MKKRSIYSLLLIILATRTLTAQTHGPHPRKSNYICDSLFTLYTNSWLDWWKHTLKIKGDVPGDSLPAHFIIPYSDLQLLDSLGHKGMIPDSVEVFYAYTSAANSKRNQITAILLLNKDSVPFKESTERWRKWSKEHIKGEQPIGFKIRYTDLDSMFHLLNNLSNPIKSMTGYFAFHSEKDKIANRMAIIFRPTFKGKQKKIDNSKIICGSSAPDDIIKHEKGSSFINIDFTNPCPPCDTSG